MIISNTHSKMKLSEIITKYNRHSGITIYHCERTLKNKNKTEAVYIVHPGNKYYIHKGDGEAYSMFTDGIITGTGMLCVMNVFTSDMSNKIMSVEDPVLMNEKIKLPVWIAKI